jgi:hypothetical protein
MVLGYVLSLPFNPFQRHTKNVTIFHKILVPSHEWVTVRFDMVCSLDGNMVESVVFKPVSVLYGILLLHMGMYGIVWTFCLCEKGICHG